MTKYICIKAAGYETCDDDGFVIDNEYFQVEKGSVWTIDDNPNSFMRGVPGLHVRLLNEDGNWLEISLETLEEDFELVEEK